MKDENWLDIPLLAFFFILVVKNHTGNNIIIPICINRYYIIISILSIRSYIITVYMCRKKKKCSFFY